jgi:hypothetical protein
MMLGLKNTFSTFLTFQMFLTTKYRGTRPPLQSGTVPWLHSKKLIQVYMVKKFKSGAQDLGN